MKKYLLLTVFVAWAGIAIASELPPYSELFAYNTVLFQQTPQETDKELRIYPNPVTDGRLNIKSGETFNLIQILNIAGEIVFSQEYPAGTTSEVIEVTDLKKGMYLIRIGFNDKPNHTAKIIIK